MTRTVLILGLVLAACDVGDATNGKTGGMVDSGVKMDSMGSGGGVDAAPVQAHTHTTPVNAGNPSNAGQGCLNANCHGAVTPAGPMFAFAGTVYTAQGGSTGAVAIAVHAGTLSAVTDTGGNFYAYSPPTLTLLCMADATTMTMTAPLSTGGGNCNSSGCHQQPGGTQGGIYK
jgi:hypothetical protein